MKINKIQFINLLKKFNFTYKPRRKKKSKVFVDGRKTVKKKI